MESLDGKVALVTGGARRVGAAIARRLHAAGAKVLIHYRDSEADAAKLEAELNAVRARSAAKVKAELLAPIAPKALVSGALESFGRLDLLVNNASTFFPVEVGAMESSHWEELIGSNLRAPLFLAQAAAPELGKREGLILNIADIHGLKPLGQHVVYCSAKAALIMLTRSLARDLGPMVRVNAIAPGPVLWPESGVDAELRKRIVERTALKRAGTPEDVAKAALFFATDAPFVTGEVLAVDGGRLAGGEGR